MPSVDLPFPVAHGLWPTVRKYSNIFRVSLIERLTYRGDFMVGVVLQFLASHHDDSALGRRSTSVPRARVWAERVAIRTRLR